MKETALTDLLAWLRTAPALRDLTLTVTDAGPRPGTGGLWLPGVTVLARTPDVCGGVTLRCRADCTLRLCLPLPPGDEATAAANAARLAALQGWIAEQSARGLAPRLGDTDPFAETLAAENARLERADAGGTACYTVRLRAEFTDFYEDDKEKNA